MPRVEMVGRVLEPEVEDILATLVQHSQRVARPERRFFVRQFLSTSGAAKVFGGGLESALDIAPQDLRELSECGYIKTERHNTSGSYEFYITPQGYKYVEVVDARDPLERPRVEVEHYLRGARFAELYPDAVRKWTHAARYLAENPTEHATRIGHDCREALAAFASALVDRHGALALDRGRGTVDSIRAVIEKYRAEMGEGTSEFLASLVSYWGTVSDLAQRQEHAAAKEGEPIDADDARRVVWYSALVMYELERTFATRLT